MKRAFIGMAGPLCYDYQNPKQVEPEIPNPILENVTGLILSYDEIWFLSRALCPLDLEEVAFVKFVEDDSELIERAQVAFNQYTDLYFDDASGWDAARGDLSVARRLWGESVRFIAEELPFKAGPDHHSRTIPGFDAMGSGEPTYNVLADLGMAASLGMKTDVIFNSYSAAIAEQLEHPHSVLTQRRIDFSEHLTAIRTIDHLGPKGAYHESLDELRMHPQVTEFRQYLTEVDVATGDLTKLATEVERAANRHAREILDRFLKGKGKIRTIGAATISAGANLVLPGSGGAISGTLATLEWIKERKMRKEMAWAPFVLDARDPR
ncbi:hypothetical protein [Streptomyces nigra]|uniref:hypothetical protein n=1 Tax=Streptomyces nigra TaxID=1827580 RepID=UPI00381DA416